MKNLVLIASFLFFAAGANAQQIVEVTNNASCDLMVQLYSVNSTTCNYTGYLDVPMSPGMALSIPANPGEEWIYTEITSFPYCTGGVALAIGTPMTCSSNCSWGAPSKAKVTNNGCNGCLPVVYATWQDPCNHPGVIVIEDF